MASPRKHEPGQGKSSVGGGGVGLRALEVSSSTSTKLAAYGGLYPTGRVTAWQLNVGEQKDVQHRAVNCEGETGTKSVARKPPA